MSSAGAPPAKRQRTDDASVTRSDIWYSDGGVVLQAQNTQFRVHWSLLAQSSSFFRDMQTLPQPPDQPSAEGCPIVELQDSAEDVKQLLTTLYTPTLPLSKTRDVPFATVAALIRLGRKYEFQTLLESALELVTGDYPATLEEFMVLPNADRNRVISYNGIGFEMVTLLRENNIMTALPAAYFRVVSEYTHAEFFAGVRNPDGRRSSLAPIDQQRCSLGREKLLVAQLQSGCTFGWLFEWSDQQDCSNVQECQLRRGNRIRRCINVVELRALNPEVITPVFCPACTRHIEKMAAAGRKKVWAELPTFFNLPPWSKLKNDP
ncbi:hypothetical protein B0H16DRAFT_1689134 [Mycena metata]|uniref:BTB domain-containing protein n=1 Tax=Mycena metata TaxID=1033252 RepID=A0AAD7J9T1_9AGAR|nr:hypothetical protein B0H16DRAFT_1689134 [Mycena metata]